MNDSNKLNNFCLQPSKQLTKSSIIGDFFIKNSLFLIVIEEGIENADGCNSVVGQLEIEGQQYLIVEVKESLRHVEHSLAELLTERELQIIAFVALGWSNKQIAKRLQISEWTVSTHLRRIFIKLGVDSRAAMVYRCAPLIQAVLQK